MALPKTGGAIPIAPHRTVFPTTHLRVSWPTFLYYASHTHFGGIRLIRFPQWLFVIVASFCVLAPLPGRWWILSLCVATLIILQWNLFRLRRRDFVIFQPETLPPVQPQVLDANDKLPIFATGHFSVENKHKRLTWLPGFYRTFATREHALLCQLAERPFSGLTNWPETEIGLWYVFFMPNTIDQVRWGQLIFGRTTLPALAVTYTIAEPTTSPIRRATEPYLETVYLAFTDEQTGMTILADLLYDLPQLSHTRIAERR